MDKPSVSENKQHAGASEAPTWVLDTRNQISDVRTWLAEIETKLDRFVELRKPPSVESVDESVAAATSVTQVHKALERELGIDRRTVLTKVERLVKAHSVADRLPGWSTDLRFAKYVAEREANGRIRLVNALAKLSERATP